jgi:hypothetical protein
MDVPRHTHRGIDRRTFLRHAGTAAATAGVAGRFASAPAGATILEGRGAGFDGRASGPLPRPIPGGFELPDEALAHVFAPGPPTVTLPFTGFTLGGLAVETSTLTDFNGFTAIAFHVGQARGSDGVVYNLETDMRAFDGEFLAEDASKHHGTFGFVCIDLFEPVSGAQMHDYNLGIAPSGLFWTTGLARHEVRVADRGTRATYEVRDLSVVDSFEFLGPREQPATVSFRIEWEATGEFVSRGHGDEVPPDDPGAFLGEFANAFSTAQFSGSQFGFSFESLPGVSTERGFAQMGTERNGAFV